MTLSLKIIIRIRVYIVRIAARVHTFITGDGIRLYDRSIPGSKYFRCTKITILSRNIDLYALQIYYELLDIYMAHCRVACCQPNRFEYNITLSTSFHNSL